VTERDVVVVGGGPAGSAAAIFLRQYGHDVLLLDEARFPRDKICGESVSPGAWPLLEGLQADDAVRSLSPAPLCGMRLTAPDGTTFEGRYREGPFPGFAVRRDRLDVTLLGVARATGVEVIEGARVTDLIVGDGRVRGVVTTTAGDERRIPCRLVVGADGRRSIVARRLGLLREHRSLRRFAVRGHWQGVEGLADAGEMHVSRGGYCGIAPLSASLANVAFVLDRREMASAAGDVEGFYRRRLGERWPHVAERLQRARLLAFPRVIGPLALTARGLSAPGALLVGDAAGFYDPFTGEGITLALRSAASAAEVAHGALRRATLGDLRDYDRRRAAATRDKFRVNRALQIVVGWPDLANSVARRLARRPELADQLVGIAGDLTPARAALDLAFGWSLLRA
jgi:menaquinone-9 beta-reductase